MSSALRRQQSNKPTLYSCQDLLSLSVTVRGNLLQRSNALDKLKRFRISLSFIIPWFERYGIVFQDVLYLFRNIVDTKPASAIELRYCKLISRASPTEIFQNEMPWVLKITLQKNEHTKFYYFAMATEQDLQDWLKKLEHCRQEAMSNYSRNTWQLNGDQTCTTELISGSTNSDTDEETDYSKIEDEAIRGINRFNKVKQELVLKKRPLPQKPSSDNQRPPLPPPPDKAAPRRSSDSMKGSQPNTTNRGGLRRAESDSQTGSTNNGLAKPNIKNKPYEATQPIQSRPPLPTPGQPQQAAKKRDTRTVPSPNYEPAEVTTEELYEFDDPMIMQFYVTKVEWTGDSGEASRFLINRRVEGSYLVRDGSEPNSKVLVVFVNGDAKKFKITEKINSSGQREFQIQEAQQFKTIPHLLSFYLINPIPNYNIKLTKAYRELS